MCNRTSETLWSMACVYAILMMLSEGEVQVVSLVLVDIYYAWKGSGDPLTTIQYDEVSFK
ncbi:hypothetical protein IHE45_16G076100 [Dioscorea alata]|uniref:Uncharacterized protein n=1 Tax=Dioscorea alata TaxID=55571 RepID=A0ACB7UIL4_DIOAL|nr:hypothetical protein IHE45_16G076100 [Dioscorea alata]